MPRSQKELDEAVIEAAEAFADSSNHDKWCEAVDSIVEAVRARREAMRPTKLRLLAAMCWHGANHPSAHQIENALDRYSGKQLDSLRDALDKLLAAPDEPMEDAK